MNLFSKYFSLVQSIEVSEKLPVIAFGHSIPRLPSKYIKKYLLNIVENNLKLINL